MQILLKIVPTYIAIEVISLPSLTLSLVGINCNQFQQKQNKILIRRRPRSFKGCSVMKRVSEWVNSYMYNFIKCNNEIIQNTYEYIKTITVNGNRVFCKNVATIKDYN
jgi:hypothetical protein